MTYLVMADIVMARLRCLEHVGGFAGTKAHGWGSQSLKHARGQWAPRRAAVRVDLFLTTFRRMPTANAEGLDRVGGRHQKGLG